MTEQEYLDLSDLQLCRTCLDIMQRVNALKGFNEARKLSIVTQLDMMVHDLEKKQMIK